MDLIQNILVTRNPLPDVIPLILPAQFPFPIPKGSGEIENVMVHISLNFISYHGLDKKKTI